MRELLILMALLAAVIGAIWVKYRGSKVYRRRRRFASTLRSRVSELEQGTVAKVCGRLAAVQDGLATAPLSGRACLVYELIVEQRERREWRLVFRHVVAAEFEVEDETGRVLVGSGNLELLASHDVVVEPSRSTPLPPGVAALLASHGIRVSVPFFRGALRVSEAAWAPGRIIAVLGNVSFVESSVATSAEGGYRDSVRRARISPVGSRSVLASDEPIARE